MLYIVLGPHYRPLETSPSSSVFVLKETLADAEIQSGDHGLLLAMGRFLLRDGVVVMASSALLYHIHCADWY